MSAAKEINDVDSSGTVKRAVQNWFRRFMEGDAKLEAKPTLWIPSVVEDGALFEMVEQQRSTNTRTLSAEHGPSQNTI